MSMKHFEKQLRYELWHQRYGHSTFQNILGTIMCVNGLESLKDLNCETHVKCPSCTSMIGKATLEDLPKANKVITKPLYQIHLDSFSFSVKSIEGYFHALLLDHVETGYRWIYGMKTKDDELNLVKRWYSKKSRLTGQT